MLSSRVRLTDPDGPGSKGNSTKLQIPTRRARRRWAYLISVVSIALTVAILAPYAFGQSKGHKGKIRRKAMPNASPGEQSLTNIPLPIGHEAKGLVLPDFDGNGHLRGKFEAGTANRIDEEHIGFQNLKIITYTPQDQPDLKIDMSTSVLNLKTRILSSKTRTTIQRSDFNIAGDSVEFDTENKTGHLVGNVKMVITDKSHLAITPAPKE